MATWKKAVGQGVHLETGLGGHGVVVHAADHVVPLEDLVQDDAVHEASQTQAVQGGRRPGMGWTFGSLGVPRDCHAPVVPPCLGPATAGGGGDRGTTARALKARP